MIPKTIKLFIKEVHSKPPKKELSHNKTNEFYSDDIWSLVVLDLKYYGSENK